MPNQASEYLKNNINSIMNLWEIRTRPKDGSTQVQTLPLRNSLPEYLMELAEILSVTGDKKETNLAGRKHGRTRAKTPNYTIDQLIFEYHILRQVIFEVLEENVELSIAQRDVIIDSIEQSVNDAATEFSDYLKEVQETLSRTLVHDLRSPLTIAKLCLGLLRIGEDNKDYNKSIQRRISTSLDRIDAMIYHLLDASIIKAGPKIKLHIEEIDLASLITRFVSEFNLIGANRFMVSSPQSLIGYWDEEGLIRILENLATNALKYSDPESPIFISAESNDERVQIVVHNIGKSIAHEDQGLIFDEFRRAKNVENKPGWGLGLTVVKSITEAHGGWVKVKSFELSGTTFTVDLPIDCRKDQNLLSNSIGPSEPNPL